MHETWQWFCFGGRRRSWNTCLHARTCIAICRIFCSDSNDRFDALKCSEEWILLQGLSVIYIQSVSIRCFIWKINRLHAQGCLPVIMFNALVILVLFYSFLSLFLPSPLLFLGVFHSCWSNEGLLTGRGKGMEERHSFPLALEISCLSFLILID